MLIGPCVEREFEVVSLLQLTLSLYNVDYFRYSKGRRHGFA